MNRMLFSDAVHVLTHSQLSCAEKITPQQKKLLEDVAEVLADAEAISRAAGLIQNAPDWKTYWNNLAAVRRVLLAVANGEAATMIAVSGAAFLCSRIALVPLLDS